VQDNNGNPMSGCSVQTWNGFDYFVRQGNSPGAPDPRLRSDVGQFGGYVGDALRATFNGSRFAGVSIDPVLGLLLNDRADHQKAQQGATERKDEKRDQQRRSHPQPVHQPRPPVRNGNINSRGRTYNQYHEWCGSRQASLGRPLISAVTS